MYEGGLQTIAVKFLMVESILNSSFTYGRGSRQKTSYQTSMLELVMHKILVAKIDNILEKIFTSIGTRQSFNFFLRHSSINKLNRFLPNPHGFQRLSSHPILKWWFSLLFSLQCIFSAIVACKIKPKRYLKIIFVCGHSTTTDQTHPKTSPMLSCRGSTRQQCWSA